MSDTILVLSNSVGGLYNFRQEVLQALIKSDFHVVIAAPQNKRVPFFEEMGCEFVETPFNIKGTNPFQDIRLAFRFRKLIKRINPFAVLTYTIKPNVYGGMACRWCGVPQIANITGLGPAVENDGWMQRITVRLYRMGMRKTHLIFFQNRANYEFFKSHFITHGASEIIPGSGVNLDFHSFKEYNTDDKVRFMFIGRILREKGIEQFLEAAQAVKKDYPSAEFHILGGGAKKYADRFKALQDEGIIIYHGHQRDARPFYEMCHCIVHPSFYPEGMSNVLLESCAMGRPIITTDRPGCGEVVEDGVNGFLVRQKDAVDLIVKIKKFINLPLDEKKQMGFNARKKVEREFDRRIVVDAYMNAIRQIKDSVD